MAAANRIYLQVDFQTDNANQNIDTLNKNIQRIGLNVNGFTSALLKSTAGAIGLATSVEGAAASLANFAVDALRSAIATETLTKTNNALATSMGVSAKAAEDLRKHFDSLGAESAESIKALNRLYTSTDIVNPAAIRKLEDFAEVLHKITGEDVVDNFNRIVDAISTGQAKTLKEIGLRIDFAALERQREFELRRDLTERERQQIRLNAVLEKSNQLSAAGVAAADTASDRISKLRVQWNQFKDDFGNRLLELFDATLKDIRAITAAWEYLLSKMNVGKPEAGGLKAYESPLPSLFQGLVQLYGQPGKPKAAVITPGTTTPAPPPPGLTGPEPKVVVTPGTGGAPGTPDIGGGQLSVAEINKKIAEVRRQAELTAYATEQLAAAQREVAAAQLEISKAKTDDLATTLAEQTSSAQGARLLEELERQRAEQRAAGLLALQQEQEQIRKNRTEYIDEYGVTHQIQLSQEAATRLQQAEDDRRFAFLEKYDEETRRIRKRITDAQTDADRQEQRRRQQFAEQTRGALDDTRINAAKDRAESINQIELAQLEAVDAVTVQQKIALEQKKTDIAKAGILQRTELEKRAIELETERQVRSKQAELTGIKYLTAEQQRQNDIEVDNIREVGAARTQALEDATQQALKLADVQNNVAQQRVFLDQARDTYNKLRDFTDQIFDAFSDKTKSTFEAIADVFKNTLKNALKEIVSSQAAGALFSLFGFGTVTQNGIGQPPTITPRAIPGGSAGGLGGLLGGGLLGGGGLFGGGSVGGGPIFSFQRPVGGLFGGGGGAGGTAPLVAATGVGGYSPYSGYSGGGYDYSPVSGTYPNGAPAGATGSLASGAIQGTLARGGLKDFLGLSNAGAFGGGAAGTAAGLLTSPAAGLIGAALFLNGAKRGGALGLAETTGGGFLAGAAIGFAVGGPIGAGIGAFVGTVVGLGVGIVGLFKKTAEQKVREKVQQVYGIQIQDKGVRQQIADIAQQRYGGNLDLAVRSPEVQQLVQLYALATGQNAKLPRPLYSAVFEQSGAGGAQLQPVYQGGQLVQSPYTGTTTTQWQQAGIYVQLDPQKANQLFEGRVVNVLQANPGSVANATANGTSAGDSRTALRGSLVEPLTVTR